MAFLLDTDVLSQPSKPIPVSAVMEWLRANEPESMHLSVATLLETNLGVGLLPAGKRKAALTRWLEEDLPGQFVQRILPITPEIALDAGHLMASANRAGHTADTIDALIAATARVHGLTVVTLNRKHFTRLRVPLIVPA